MIYLIVLLVNLTIVALGAYIFVETGSLWSMLVLLFLMGIKTAKEDE